MRYFYRANCAPETVLEFARTYFTGRSFSAQMGQGDHARFTGPLGAVDVFVEIEGGHYTRVNVATSAVGESFVDKRAKRFLSELHRLAEPAHQVRGAY
jgi:hypothetical protein